jgi:hypothetical protein
MSKGKKNEMSKDFIETDKDSKLNLQFTAKDFIISQLEIYRLKLLGASDIKGARKKTALAEIDKAINIIKDKIEAIHFNKAEQQPGGIQYSITQYENVKRASTDDLEDVFIRPDSITRFIVRSFLYPKEGLVEPEKLHKQPRNLLKTVAQRISNTTDEPTLFTLPQKVEPGGGGAIGELKEEISKNTGALAFYLIQKYQENNSKPLEINNLNAIAEVMNCTNYRLKLYLLYLGGYVYPIVDRDERTRELVLTNEQLFKIEFRYSEQIADKYSVSSRGEIQGVERIGNNLLNFIKDEPLDRVTITPSERFIKALEGKGLGNILTVNNKFVGLILELTDIATKILTYSSSNKPSCKIGEDNLIKHLGLNKQIKKQGKPRVRATILKGLQELQDKEHIKSYSYEEATGMYNYTYSDKYVKYKESKKGKKEPTEGIQ